MSTSMPLPFDQRKAIGDESEALFSEKIRLAGGRVAFIGKAPNTPGKTPRFGHPSPKHENGIYYSVAPDLMVSLPNDPITTYSMVQVKRKKPTTSRSGNRFVYLDEKELHRMTRLIDHGDIIFVIHVEETDHRPEEWLWTTAQTLRDTEFLKQSKQNKPTFLIPLTIFEPFETLVKRTSPERLPYVPANTNTPPANERPRTQTH